MRFRVLKVFAIFAGVLSLGPAANATGNGFPSGQHYNLNIIGVQNTKNFSPTCGSGGVIFVPLSGQTKILLQEGPVFQVLNCDAVNGSALFELPAADPNNTGTTSYSVFSRALGTPGGSSSLTTCATDVSTGEVVCSLQSAVSFRDSGQSKAVNVSADLLYLYYQNSTGGTTRVSLFESGFINFFWDYVNNNLKLLQLRFYPGVSTTVP